MIARVGAGGPTSFRKCPHATIRRSVQLFRDEAFVPFDRDTSGVVGADLGGVVGGPFRALAGERRGRRVEEEEEESNCQSSELKLEHDC